MKSKTRTVEEARIQAIADGCNSWEEAVDKLEGCDLIYSVSTIKRKWAVTDEEILAYLRK